MEEILELEKQIEEANKHIEELKKQVEELKEIQKQDKKEHKTLSDYRCYSGLEKGQEYKYIMHSNYIDEYRWHNDEIDKFILRNGNCYSIDTPNKLLKREIKKRQLWFALEKHLKEKGCLPTNEDFKPGNAKEKFSCYYSFLSGNFAIDSSYNCKANTIYSTDFIVLRNYVNTLTKKDIKIMFDVE